MRVALGMTMAAMVAGGAVQARAEPGLANQVYSPYVKKGVTELEFRGGRLNGGALDGESAGIAELERGISDRVSLAVVAEFEHHAGGETKLDALGLEGKLYLGQIPGLGIDVGGYVEYEQRLNNESGVAEVKLLLAKQAGPFEGVMNLIARRPLTDKPGEDLATFGYAAQLTRGAGHGTRLGLQAFGDLGNEQKLGGRQSHYLGPMIRWEGRLGGGPSELELEVAYLLPLGAARRETDGQVRMSLAWERKF